MGIFHGRGTLWKSSKKAGAPLSTAHTKAILQEILVDIPNAFTDVIVRLRKPPNHNTYIFVQVSVTDKTDLIARFDIFVKSYQCEQCGGILQDLLTFHQASTQRVVELPFCRSYQSKEEISFTCQQRKCQLQHHVPKAGHQLEEDADNVVEFSRHHVPKAGHQLEEDADNVVEFSRIF
ncbi:hypothetical protein QE152_g6381 [Popillia japonica]|uniref:Uncharacterized protein n=1 Tax=Popillia japonica TaxID=7064 RepID=A0AAW1MIV5_POPJA